MLEEYKKKRSFAKSPEPSGDDGGNELKSGVEPLFVVQKHDASRLHYDLRLEHNGVLLSWAVPKGPSYDPGDKRLAVHVEDHPMDYADFEGIIPKGEYGGGTVMLWDRGSLEPENDFDDGLKKGKLRFTLHGEKLEGSWELVRMGGSNSDGDKDNWLFFKRKDKFADPERNITNSATKSVKTGRGMKAIASEAPADKAIWSDDEQLIEELSRQSAENNTDSPQKLLEGMDQKQQGFPEEVSPQLATLVKSVPQGDEWLHEMKYDGYRLLAHKTGHSVRLMTRNGKDWTAKFESIANAVTEIPEDCVLDGEVVVLDDHGRSRFGLLQKNLKGRTKRPQVFYAFDLPACGGYDLRECPLRERKQLLKTVLQPVLGKIVRYSDHVHGSGKPFYQKACEMELEGVIAKKAEAPYRGKRNRDWVKIKCERRQEFIICGFTAPGGSRSHFGALLCAYHDENGDLRYAGKVGTGYDEKTLEEVHGKLRRLTRKTSPLDEEIPRSETRDVTWVTPKHVAEISFTEMTADNRLRHPVFHGLREDKEPKTVVFEQPNLEANAKPEPQKEANAQKSKAAPKAERSSSRGSNKTERPSVGHVSISNPDREVFPSASITKFELAQYFQRIAEHMLPFLANRPLSLVRCPRGREQKCFFQKHFADSVPDFVHITKFEEKKGRAPYSYIDDADGLVSLAQWGVIEFHPWGSRVDRTDRPDVLIFDLDPNPDVKWEEVLGATFLIRDILENELDLKTFVKTSGGKGLHVYVPIERYSDWEEARQFTKSVSEAVKRQNPGKFVTVSTKAKREGKIFIDYLRNGRGATSVAPFSPRARECGPVSVPIGWHEISADLRADQYTLQNIFNRLGALKHDPWKDFFDVKQRISKSLLEKVKKL